MTFFHSSVLDMKMHVDIRIIQKFMIFAFQKPDFTVAIKCITKKNLAKSQNLLSKEIKILRVRHEYSSHASTMLSLNLNMYLLSNDS